MPERTFRPPAHGRTCRRSAILAGPLAALAALAACDVPTELPAFDTRWVVPAEETRFGVDELLPTAVQLTTTEDAFVVDFSPVNFTETLGGLCPACIPFNGLNVPKPLFFGSLASGISFPADVSSIALLSGDVGIDLQNGTSFDILQPAAGAFGEIVITVTDDADGDVLGTLTIDGTVTPFPAGTTLQRTMALAPTTVEGSIVATVEVDSPLGDPVTIDVSDLLSATATPTNIVVTAVTVAVAGLSVNLDPVDLDVGDVDADLVDRVQSGGFILDVVNPFGIGANFQLTIDGPTISPIQKAASVGTAPTSSVAILFTRGELQSFLGQDFVTLTGGAVVDPGAAPITVTPGQELVLDGKLDLTLRIGG